MARLLIAEPHDSGHRAKYCYWLARDAIAIGHDVTVVTLPASAGNSHYAELANRASGAFRTEAFAGHFPHTVTGESNLHMLFEEWRYWRWLKLAYEAVKRVRDIDFVVVPYLDYCLHVAGCVGSPFGPTPWTGITMRVGFHRQAVGIGSNATGSWIRRKIFSRLLASNTLVRVFTIDEVLNDFISHEPQFDKLRHKVRYLSDPAEVSSLPSSAESRATLGISSDAFVVLVFGSITLRKGISQLVASLDAELKENDREICLVVAGRCDDEVRQLFERGIGRRLAEHKRLRVIDRFVEPEVEATVFAAANVVWLGYVNHPGMSGVLVQAGQARLPVLGSEEGLLSYLISKYGLGLRVNVSDSNSIRQSLRRLMADSAFAAECGKRGHEKFRTHTPDAFAKSILAEQANPQPNDLRARASTRNLAT